jgi:hypothetical protein
MISLVRSGQKTSGSGAAQTAPTPANPDLTGVDMQDTATAVKHRANRAR